jgi:hypothetical protein
MNPHTITLLAAARRDELLADAARYRAHRQYRNSRRQPRSGTPNTGRLRRGILTMNALVDASQL